MTPRRPSRRRREARAQRRLAAGPAPGLTAPERTEADPKALAGRALLGVAAALAAGRLQRAEGLARLAERLGRIALRPGGHEIMTLEDELAARRTLYARISALAEADRARAARGAAETTPGDAEAGGPPPPGPLPDLGLVR